MEIKMNAWIHFEVRLLAQGVYTKIPMGPPPHEVSAWSMGFPEAMAMELPVAILIPMQIGTHGYSIPAEMRRGRLGHGAAQGAGPALAPSNHPSGLQPIPIEIPMNIHMGNPMEIPCGLWISPMWTLPWRFLRRSLFPRRPQWKFDSRGDAPGVCGGAAWGTGLPRARGQLWHL